MNTILLTVAVTPNVLSRVVVDQPLVRLHHYREAISAWASATERIGFSLAVVETTGALASEVVPESARGRTTFLSYAPSGDRRLRGKGAAEFGAIAHAIQVLGLPDSATLYKCTGRLVLVNADRLLTPVADRTVRVRGTLDRSWFDTRLLGAQVSVWQDTLLNAGARADDTKGLFLERTVAAVVSSEAALGRLSIETFRERPRFEGSSGSTGVRYTRRFARLRAIFDAPLEAGLRRLAASKQA